MLFNHCTFCARLMEFSILNEGLFFSSLNEWFRFISEFFLHFKDIIIELGCENMHYYMKSGVKLQ